MEEGEVSSEGSEEKSSEMANHHLSNVALSGARRRASNQEANQPSLATLLHFEIQGVGLAA